MKKIANTFLIILFLIYIYLVLAISTYNIFNILNIQSTIINIILSSVFVFIFIKYITKKLDNISITKKEIKDSLFLILFLLSFIVLLSWLLAYFPGEINEDNAGQYEMALGITEYGNWHPLFHTLLFIKLPLLIFKNYSILGLLNITLYSIALAYLFNTLYKYGLNKKIVISLFLLIIINPYINNQIMSPVKDIPFLALIIILVTYFIKTYFEKDKWINKKTNIILLSLVFVIEFLIRRNSILFLFPMFVIILFNLSKKNKIKLTGITITLILIISSIINQIEVIDQYKYKIEMLGTPLAIWINVASKEYDKLPNRTQKELEKLMPKSEYLRFDQKYIYGAYLKFAPQFDLEKGNELSWNKIYTMTLDCIKTSPELAYRGLLFSYNYSLGFDIRDYPENMRNVNIAHNTRIQNVELFNKIVKELTLFLTSNIVFRLFFGSFGIYNLIFVCLFIYFFYRNRYSCLYFIPVIFFNFGTTLLIADYDPRFFLESFIIYLPLIFVAFNDTKKLFNNRGVLDEKKESSNNRCRASRANSSIRTIK